MTQCIRVQHVGLPQKAMPVTVFMLSAMAEFCSQPETFPVFHAWLIAHAAPLPDLAEAVGDLTPSIIGGFGDFLTEGLIPEATP
jgi:hypothetical protein